MTIKTRTYPIVGAHFRPPAEILLKVAPVGTRLWLTPEPMNPFDPNAIAVHCDLDGPLTLNKVREALLASGNTDWVNKSYIQIGYLPRPIAKSLKERGFDSEHSAELYYPFGSNLPHAKFDFDDPDKE